MFPYLFRKTALRPAELLNQKKACFDFIRFSLLTFENWSKKYMSGGFRYPVELATGREDMWLSLIKINNKYQQLH